MGGAKVFRQRTRFCPFIEDSAFTFKAHGKGVYGLGSVSGHVVDDAR